MAVGLVFVVAFCMVANAGRLRRRLRALRPLALAPPASGTAHDHLLLTVRGVEVPPEVERAAVHHAREHGYGLVDLLPRDLPVEGTLDLARHLDFDAYRADPFG